MSSRVRQPYPAEETGQRDTSAAGRNAIRRALRREVCWRRRRGVVLAKTFLENRLKVSAAAPAAAAAAVATLASAVAAATVTAPAVAAVAVEAPANTASAPASEPVTIKIAAAAAAAVAAAVTATTETTVAAATATAAVITKVGAAGLPPPVCLGGGGDAAGIGCLRNADSEGVGPESIRTRGVAFGDGAAGGRSKRRRADVDGMWAAPTTRGRGSGGVEGVVLEEAVPLRGVLEGLMDLAGCEEALFRQVVMFL